MKNKTNTPLPVKEKRVYKKKVHNEDFVISSMRSDYWRAKLDECATRTNVKIGNLFSVQEESLQRLNFWGKVKHIFFSPIFKKPVKQSVSFYVIGEAKYINRFKKELKKHFNFDEKISQHSDN